MTTPTNPTMTAAQRCGPTCSFSNGTDNAVIKKVVPKKNHGGIGQGHHLQGLKKQQWGKEAQHAPHKMHAGLGCVQGTARQHPPHPNRHNRGDKPTAHRQNLQNAKA